MKILMISALLFSGVFQTAQAAEAKSEYYKCMCNFNACLGERSKSCVAIVRCKKTTAADYAYTVHNHKSLLVLDEKAYCWSPYQ